MATPSPKKSFYAARREHVQTKPGDEDTPENRQIIPGSPRRDLETTDAKIAEDRRTDPEILVLA